MIKCGDIGISNRPSGWYSRGVRFFTRSNWSHCFILGVPYLERASVLEADLKVQLVDWEKEYIHKRKDAWMIFEPILASNSCRVSAAEETFKFYNGMTYGFLQIPWFTVRAFLKWIGIGKTTRNYFPSGVICSELVLFYLKKLGGEYEESFKHLTLDETSPQDILTLIYSYPNLFKFVAAREL